MPPLLYEQEMEVVRSSKGFNEQEDNEDTSGCSIINEQEIEVDGVVRQALIPYDNSSIPLEVDSINTQHSTLSSKRETQE